MIVTSEYLFSNPKLKEIINFIKKIDLEMNKNMVIIIIEKLMLNVTSNFLIKKTKQKILRLSVITYLDE